MRQLFIISASILALAAASASPAWASWACGARSSGGAIGRAWLEPTEAEARDGALQSCREIGGHRCRIISCAENVQTREQAHARWPGGAGTTSKCLEGKCR